MDGIWVTKTCCTCHVQYKITAEHQQQLMQSHETFYCPNGHSLYFPGETEEEKLKKQLEAKERDMQRLWEEDEQARLKIRELEKKLKEAEKKRQEPEKPIIVKRRLSYIFNEEPIDQIHKTKIYPAIVKHLEENLKPDFSLKDIARELTVFYKTKLKRKLRANSIKTYSRNYKDHMLKAGIIQKKGDGMYQPTEHVKPDLPKKPPVKLSYLEKWLIEKMPRKIFDIEDFFRDYPKQRHHKARVEKSLRELINRRILTQMGNNRFKLRVDRIEQEIVQ